VERGKTESDNLALRIENDIAAFNLSNPGLVIRNRVEKDAELSYAILMKAPREVWVHTLKPKLEKENLEGEEDKFAEKQREQAIAEFERDGKSFIEFITPIRISSQQWGVLRLIYSLAALNQEIADTRLEIVRQNRSMVVRSIVTSVLFIALGSAIVLWLSTRLAGPLTKLTRVADELAKGDFSVAKNITIRSKDEVGLLSRSFVEMSKQLKISYDKLEDYSRTLEQKVEERTKELVHMTQEAQEARVAAEEANRIKSQFLSTMSHELRTPLNAIIGYSEMLEEECEEEGHADFVPDLQKIHWAGKHLLGLINDILDLSKIEAGKMELFLEDLDIQGIIRAATSTINPMVEKNNNVLVVQVPDDIGRMSADSTRVRQILFNLLSNACKFTENGTVTLEAAREMADQGDWILFKISDTGIGMSSEQMEKLFQTFTQVHDTSQKYDGTGLGLSITKHLCQMMGGSIDVKSSSGAGSTFSVYLPADVGKQVPEAGMAPLEKEIEPTKPKEGNNLILVIDDDPDCREMTSRHLRKEGFAVKTAPNGESGLQMARQLHPSVITLDVLMPDMDGWVVLRELKADPELAEVPVIMITIVDNKQMGQALGVADYLTKPVDFKELVRIVKKYA
jgi:signal transduction histidine kinase